MSTLGGPKIVTSGLETCLNVDDKNSYSGSGDTWRDIVTGNAYVSNVSGPNPSWANDVNNITVEVLLQKTGVLVGYASHPVNKWNGGTGNASFVLYQFGNYNNNGADGAFAWYFTRESAGWGGIAYPTAFVTNQYGHMVFTYSSTNGANIYLNGENVGSAIAAGRLGVAGGSNIVVHGPTDNGHTKVLHTAFYSRILSATEVRSNFRALRGRVGL